MRTNNDQFEMRRFILNVTQSHVYYIIFYHINNDKVTQDSLNIIFHIIKRNVSKIS